MTHIVIHDDRDGVTRYHQFDDVCDAAGFLEMLYNEGTDDARLYALHEVDFAVKSYVKVEIGGTEVPKRREARAAAPEPKRREARAAAPEPGATVARAGSPESEPTVARAAAPDPETLITAAAEQETPEVDEPELIPMDDVEYVEASPAPPEPVATEPVEVAGSTEPRRGLFGR